MIKQLFPKNAFYSFMAPPHILNRFFVIKEFLLCVDIWEPETVALGVTTMLGLHIQGLVRLIEISKLAERKNASHTKSDLHIVETAFRTK